MRIGYARVSTEDQTLDLQKDALKRAKCREVYEDQATGKNTCHCRDKTPAFLPVLTTTARALGRDLARLSC